MLYRDSGVDIERADDVKKKIAQLVKSTFNENTLTEIGAFGGAFKFGDKILVSSTDGIGTKVILARMMNEFEGLGHDIVNHCVDDILTLGALPLFFLDYYAGHSIDNRVLLPFIKGAADACRENGVVLIGGETAQLPDLYREGDFDIAGFIVGYVEDRIIDGKGIKSGDKVYGLPSSGLHTNGYTLARKVCFKIKGLTPDTYIQELGESIGEALLRPHVSYLKLIKPHISKIKGLAHITGGGFEGNISRVLPEDVDCVIDTGRWEVPALFKLLQEWGDIPDREMYRTFNMGIGMVVIGHRVEGSIEIGEIVEGKGRVKLEGLRDS